MAVLPRQRGGSFRYGMFPLLLVLLLAGQRQVFGDAQQQGFVVDASGEMETIDSSPHFDKEAEAAVVQEKREDSPEKTPEALSAEAGGGQKDAGGAGQVCVDVSPIEKELDASNAELAATRELLLSQQEGAETLKAEHESELGKCGSERKTLQHEVDNLKAVHTSELVTCEGHVDTLKGEVGTLGGALELAGGEAGIKDLVASVAAAETAKAENEAALKEKENALRLEKDSTKKLTGALDAARGELKELRGVLSDAEARESEAREEAGRHANAKEEVRRKLERTESELEMAKRPRKVSVTAIAADVQELFADVMRQSADARDDIAARAKLYAGQANEAIQPLVHYAKKISAPWVEKGMVASAPFRARATEEFELYRGKLDEAVGKPAAEKCSWAKEEMMKVLSQVNVKWEEFEVTLAKQLIKAGLSEGDAEKVCKYLNMSVLALAAVLFVVYLAGTVLRGIVLPLVRTVLRVALWVVKIPFFVIFLPVRLVFWVLAVLFRLVFGRGGGGSGRKVGGASAGGGKRVKTGTTAKARR